VQICQITGLTIEEIEKIWTSADYSRGDFESPRE